MLNQKRPSPIALLMSGVLWVASVGLAILSTFALRDLFVWGLALLLASPDQARRLQAATTINFAQNCAIMVFGILSLVVIVTSSELFFRDAGQPRLLRRLARVVAAECVIVLPTALLFWR